MANVFRLDDNYVDKPKRNVYDLSCQNNLTLKFGKLIPVVCKEVLPGDSFQIKARFGLKYLPQVFPVQTRQRASIKYYYVRNRNLWKDWMDFIGKTKTGLTPPYLQFSGDDNKYLSPSSIADYMGIPINVKSSMKGRTSLKAAQPNFVKGNKYAFIPNSDTTFSNQKGDPNAILTRKYTGVIFGIPSQNTSDVMPMDWLYGGASPSSVVDMPLYLNLDSGVGNYFRPQQYGGTLVHLGLFRKPLIPANGEFSVNWDNGPEGNKCYIILRDETGVDYLRPLTSTQSNINISSSLRVAYTYSNESTNNVPTVGYEYVQLKSVVGYVLINVEDDVNPILPNFDLNLSLQQNDNLCWCDIAYTDWPFANAAKADGIRISALPFRAIQSVYNALIRNAENNPYRINGVVEYNKYIRTDEGGATYCYDLLDDYLTNWADDRFTTSLPSPQQGNAPLVGLTGVQGATLTTSTNDGTTSTLHLKVDSNTGNVVMVDGVSSDSPEYLNDAIMSAVEYGITINDLRNVNSFQRWLENNIRRGYKYKDQLMSHYGVSARYDVLDMPEFIGGVSRDIDVTQITQTVENEYGNLGDYAGQSYLTDDGHEIEKYCDEHGFIIGLLCVYPMPIYQDTLPKYLCKTDAFDYYFPEFGKIGPQPITKKEIAFSQSFLEDNQDETFGYQRAWYDYLESLDEVHGLYSSDFRNFILARDFLQVPTLGADFLTIDNEDINNTFYVDDDKDKILGQVYHKISVKRSIPLLGIPSIEP